MEKCIQGRLGVNIMAALYWMINLEIGNRKR